MPNPTLRDLTGLPRAAPGLHSAALIMIDLQNTYREGVMRLHNVEPALVHAAELLARARHARIPILHIQHDAGAGTPYDVTAPIGAISAPVAPAPGEPVIVKHYPNAFVQTGLEERLRGLGVANLVLAGFMTHMCVNSTAQGAFSLGFSPVVVAAATATRDLAGVSALDLQAATLASLSDLYAVVVPDLQAIPE